MASTSKSVSTKDIDSESSSFLNCLGRLPDEVLIMIFQMLPVETLLLLEQSEDWVKRLVFSSKVGNFMSSSFMSLEKVKLFIKPRSRYIKELYFDNLVSGSSLQLSRIIMKCSQLKVLSIKNCGVILEHLYLILERVNLEELSYTVINQLNEHPTKYTHKDSGALNVKQLKKISLVSGDLIVFQRFVEYFFPLCLDLTEIRLEFSNFWKYQIFVHRNLEGDMFFQESASSPYLPNLCHLVITCPLMKTLQMDDVKRWKIHFLNPMLQWLFHKQSSEIDWKSFWISDSFSTASALRLCKISPQHLTSASSLFLMDDDNDSCSIDVLKSCPSNSIRQLGLYVPRLSQNHVQLIKRAGGKQLKQFSAIAAFRNNVLLEVKPFYDLLKSCTNITDLDISGIHVTDHHNTSFCSAIVVLRNLRRLCLPVCAITDVPVHISPTYLKDPNLDLFAPPTARKRICKHVALNQYASEVFAAMVKSCPLVEDFHLTGCFRCGQSERGSIFCENIIGSIYMWCHLKHLRIDNVPSLRLFTFLCEVARYCDNFTSLHLANIGHPDVFHFMSALTTVLQSAKKFAFLRIVHCMFNCSDESFWKAVAGASNLQGLCIASDHGEFINRKLVCSSVAQLKYFHVFHLHCKLALQSSAFCREMRSILSQKTCRGSYVEDVNFILNNVSHEDFSPLIREPLCHHCHCGVRESSVKEPYLSHEGN